MLVGMVWGRGEGGRGRLRGRRQKGGNGKGLKGLLTMVSWDGDVEGERRRMGDGEGERTDMRFVKAVAGERSRLC